MQKQLEFSNERQQWLPVQRKLPQKNIEYLEIASGVVGLENIERK